MFKESFKYYKSKRSQPDFKDVLNFNNELDATKVKIIAPEEPSEELYGLKPVKQWEIFKVIANPGLIFIKNPFTPLGQRYWITKCLSEYPRKPNKSNLDSYNVLSDFENWWDVCQNNKDEKLLNQLRWITFGYHHNWDTKIYSENSKSEFPLDLKHMCHVIGSNLGFKNFEAEAAIVNYYHMDSTLSGHTDHSEQNLEAPLFSFSFGQTAIFLLGGRTIDVPPTAMYLHSGDIVIMSEEARLSYHGVPKILKTNKKSWNYTSDIYGKSETKESSEFKKINKTDGNCIEKENNLEKSSDKLLPKFYSKVTVENCLSENFWLPFESYLKTSRININVRQVLNRGEKRLLED